jgi:hypothetical protein
MFRMLTSYDIFGTPKGDITAPLVPPPVSHAYLPDNPERFGETSWERLIRGRPIGKRIVFEYAPTDDDEQFAPIEFFTLGGEDRDAVQMRVVLSSPTIIKISADDLAGINLQNLSGEYFNNTVGVDDFPGTVDPVIWPPISALIEWGTNARAHAIVDVRNGSPVNVSASWLRVRGLITPDAANVPGTAGAYVMSAFASPGWADSKAAARTIFLGTVDASASSDVFAVPPFARKATVVGMDATGVVETSYLNFWQSPDGTHPVGSYFTNGNQPGPFRVPNGAQYFSILAGATSAYAVLFDLSI